MRVLDLCIVADRNCPTSRAYLTYLYAAGYRVRRILLVDFLPPDNIPKNILVRKYTSFKGRQNYKSLAVMPTAEFREICEVIQSIFDIRVCFFSEFNFEKFGDQVTTLIASDYNDVVLKNELIKDTGHTYLYTNGGRVPADLLNSGFGKIIHIHPGIVPDVKGSDCLLWSLLVRGRPGMSCFYMNNGIDTGDIIFRREFSFVELQKALQKRVCSSMELYRALLFAYDPHLRAQTLLDAIQLRHGTRLDDIPTQKQDKNGGRTFFWMHPRLIERTISDFFGNNSVD